MIVNDHVVNSINIYVLQAKCVLITQFTHVGGVVQKFSCFHSPFKNETHFVSNIFDILVIIMTILIHIDLFNNIK